MKKLKSCSKHLEKDVCVFFCKFQQAHKLNRFGCALEIGSVHWLEFHYAVNLDAVDKGYAAV